MRGKVQRGRASRAVRSQAEPGNENRLPAIADRGYTQVAANGSPANGSIVGIARAGGEIFAVVGLEGRNEIDGAVAAILAMSPNFSEAVFNNQAAVTAAQAAVLQLKETLESEVLPIVTGL